MKTLVFRLPWPPSINHYYGRRRQGGVFLKDRGRLYRKLALVEFARLGWPRLEGAVKVSLLLCPPDRRVRDIDNIRKAVYDALSDRRKGKALVHQGIIADDKFIHEDDAQRIEEPGGGWVQVTISQLKGNDL